MYDFTMPSLGADMDQGTLVEWLVKPGDQVARGDIVAVVETDKGAIDIEIFVSGTVRELVATPGREVAVGGLLARLDSDDVAAAPAPPPPAVTAPAAAAETVGAPPPAPAPSGGRLRVSPLARRRAAELGVDLAALTGSGPHGAVTVADVEAAAPAPATAAAPADAAARRQAMRQAIGAAMARAKREIPHYYLAQTIDLTAALDWLEAENARRTVSERLLPAVLLIKAVANAMGQVPELNGVWRDGGFTPSPAVHVGAAIALRGGGLIAPALRDAGDKDLGVLMAEFRDLVKRARGGGLRSSELSDPTVTVTSLGERGVETVYPVIYPPQVAIVGFGAIVTRPWVVADAVVPRRLVVATLAADHRVSDGHRGGLFLRAVDDLLQQPEAL